MRPIIAAVVSIDIDDFLEWKHLRGHANYMTGTHRKYQVGNTLYVCITKVIDLCSLAVDEIIITMHAHKNPEFEEIVRVAQSNLNTIKPKNEVNTIKQMKISDVKYVGIVKAREWFKTDGLAFIFQDDYVVGEWCDYNDGVNSHIEGKTTIGIFRELTTAEIVYNNRLLSSVKFPTEEEIDKFADKYHGGEIYIFATIAWIKDWMKNHGI